MCIATGIGVSQSSDFPDRSHSSFQVRFGHPGFDSRYYARAQNSCIAKDRNQT
jgi:hypothetical protein